nr:RHS repeat-associated core domain-containing protein [Streptomyces sp. WAC05374]
MSLVGTDDEVVVVRAPVTNDATQAVTRRKSTIFGAPRGSQPANWTGKKGFVGGTNDTETALTHIGAREYDPTIGRFISVDPIMDLTDSQQLHGYTYANNSPVTYSDPTGLMPDHGGGTSSCTYPCKSEADAIMAKEKQPNQGNGKSHDNGKKGVMSQADSAFTNVDGSTWTFTDDNPKQCQLWTGDEIRRTQQSRDLHHSPQRRKEVRRQLHRQHENTCQQVDAFTPRGP